MTDGIGVEINYDRIFYRPIGVIFSNHEGDIEFISSFHEKSSDESCFILSHLNCYFDAWDLIDGLATCSSLSKMFNWRQYVHEKYEVV
jgi:hypothetical protein